MTDELAPRLDRKISVPDGRQAIYNFNSDVGTVLNNSGTINQNSVVVSIMPSGDRRQKRQSMRFNLSHYNLFVVEDEDFSFYEGSFLLDRRQVLCRCIDDKVRAAHPLSDPAVLDKVKTYPCVFAGVNERYGRPGDTQLAAMGAITDVSVAKDGIRVSYMTIKDIPQKALLEAAPALGIRVAQLMNELDDTHWTIKKADIQQAMLDVGVDVFSVL